VIPRLKQQYTDEVKAAIKQQLGIANDMDIPTLDKIVVNMGVGDAMNDKGLIDSAVEDLATITGQRPKVNIARKSIANFKLREGVAIGANVTLRGDRMWSSSIVSSRWRFPASGTSAGSTRAASTGTATTRSA